MTINDINKPRKTKRIPVKVLEEITTDMILKLGPPKFAVGYDGTIYADSKSVEWHDNNGMNTPYKVSHV